MEYSTLQLAKAFDWSRATVQRWLEQERITPKKKAEGRGDRSLFGENDVRCLLLFQLFRDAGFTTEKSTYFARRHADGENLEELPYLLIGKRRDGRGFDYGLESRASRIPEKLPPILAPNGFMLVVNLNQLFTDAREKLAGIE